MAQAIPTKWSITHSPDELSSDGTAAYNQLDGVSCATRTFCEAVGAGPQGGLVETWNGTSWSLSSGTVPGDLYGVSCTGTQYCVAVGQTILNDGQVMTFPVPRNGSSGTLLGVSCTSSTDCVAVGFYFDTALDNYFPLIDEL